VNAWRAPQKIGLAHLLNQIHESQPRDLVVLDGGAMSRSNNAQAPLDASGRLYPASECAASTASPVRNVTAQSTTGGQIAEGGDDVARFVAGRRSDGGGQ
jgi:hypothetical protein